MSNEQLGFVFRLTANRISFDNASIYFNFALRLVETSP